MFQPIHSTSAAGRTVARVAAALALLAGLVAAPAFAAEVVQIRIGNHPTFTRVVFELDRSAGYRVQRDGGAASDELVVTLNASSRARSIRSKSPGVELVEVRPGGAESVAHVSLRKQGLRLKEMILANPPRIVLDVMYDDAMLAKLAPPPKVARKPEPKVAKTPEPAPEPKVAKTPVAPPAPKQTPEPKVAKSPEPAPEPKVAKTPEPAPDTAKLPVTVPVPVPAPKLAKQPEPASETAKTPELAQKLAKTPEPAPEPKRAEPPAPKMAKAPATVVVTPTAKAPAASLVLPLADAPDMPAVRDAAKPEPAPQTTTADSPTPPGATPPAPDGGPAGATAKEMADAGEKTAAEPPSAPSKAADAALAKPAPSDRAKPKPEAARVEPPAPKQPGALSKLRPRLPDWLPSPIVLGAGGGLLVCAIAFVFLIRRRRPLPNDLDVTAIAEAGSASAGQSRDSLFGEAAASDTASFSDLFDDEPQQTPSSAKAAARGGAGDAASFDNLFGDAEAAPAAKGDAPMPRTSDLPADPGRTTAAPSRSASTAAPDTDVLRLVHELERRMGQLESKLAEANEARERLERQVAAQSEELRVQRAAIARTQRALRTMSRGDEDKATEPALRDGDTQARTRANPA